MKKEINEIEIRLPDIFAAVFKAARTIVCLALILALIGGLWEAYKVIDAAKNPSVTEDDVAAAEKAVKNAEDKVTAAEKSLTKLYEIEIPDAETTLSRAESLAERRKDYIDNSLYYAMNPFHRGVSRVTLYIDTDTPVNPNSPWMTVNPQSSIAIAYTKIYPFDSEILENIKRIMGTDADMQYINELVSVSNVSNQFVEICVYHDNAETARQVTDYLLDTLQKRLYESVGEYRSNIIGSFVGYEVDWGMSENHNTQDDNLLAAERNVVSLEESVQRLKGETRESREKAIEDAKAGVEEAKENLEDVKEQFSNTSADPKNILKRALKKAILFFVLGFALCVFTAAVLRLLSSKLQDISTVLTRYAFPVIGVIPKKKKRWFDKTIRKLEGEPLIDYEAAGKAVAQSLFSIIGEKKVAFVSSEGQALIDQILSFTGERVPVCGNIIQDAEAMKSTADYDGFILVEERGKSRIDMIDSEVRRITSLGKKTEGVILL